MTTPAKRDSNETGGDPQKTETTTTTAASSSSSSKRPKREEEEHRWMTYGGRRQPRVGNEYQVASLPTPGSSNPAAADTATIPDDEATAPSSNSKVMDKKNEIQQQQPE
jgi:hypothetical protein